MMIAVLMISLLVFLLLGMPIYVSLGLGSFVSLLFFSDGNPVMLIQRFFAGIDTFGLMALPFFILAANLMDTGGLSSRILNVARALVGHVTGGMAMTTQLASMFFGALSGSSPATVMAIGKIMNRELVRTGYSKSFISGLLASSGSVDYSAKYHFDYLCGCCTQCVSRQAVYGRLGRRDCIRACQHRLYLYLFSQK